MTRVLLVDDDPLVQLAYKGALSRRGFDVKLAEDGVAALKSMHEARPDIVVLDMMMPRLSGGDVLRLMRSQPSLAQLPVIIFSNSYIDAETAKSAGTGAQKGLLKSGCTPAILEDTIREVLTGPQQSNGAAQLLTVPEATPAQAAQQDRISDAEWRETTRAQLLAGAKATCAALRTAFVAWTAAADGKERALRLQQLYRRVHFLTTLAGMAEHHRMAQVLTALEALVFRLTEEAALTIPSVFVTVSSAVDFVVMLFHEAKQGYFGPAIEGKVLVVDDDPVSNRLVTWALATANLRARSTEDPVAGLQLLTQEQYDLILLDVEMPGMSGFEFCKRARTMPAYATVPIIYVTIHSEFEQRARGAMAGGDDLIAKPVLPTELAVKTTMHLLKRHAPAVAETTT